MDEIKSQILINVIEILRTQLEKQISILDPHLISYEKYIENTKLLEIQIAYLEDAKQFLISQNFKQSYWHKIKLLWSKIFTKKNKLHMSEHWSN